jgi:hypothetical protein
LSPRLSWEVKLVNRLGKKLAILAAQTYDQAAPSMRAEYMPDCVGREWKGEDYN